MKKLIAIVWCSVITLTTIPQNTSGEELIPKDPKAKEILEKLSTKTKAYSSMRAEFSYRILNETEKIDETQSGSLVVKGKKYRLGIAGQEIISNGLVIWTHMPDADEVQIDNMPDDAETDNMFNPANIFTIYEDGFKYKFDREEGGNQFIKLYPIDANDKPYHTAILTIDKAKNEMKSVEVLAKDGNKYTYTINKFESNIEANDADFEFDTSKVSEVVDMRE